MKTKLLKKIRKKYDIVFCRDRNGVANKIMYKNIKTGFVSYYYSYDIKIFLFEIYCNVLGGFTEALRWQRKKDNTILNNEFKKHKSLN